MNAASKKSSDDDERLEPSSSSPSEISTEGEERAGGSHRHQALREKVKSVMMDAAFFERADKQDDGCLLKSEAAHAQKHLNLTVPDELRKSSWVNGLI